MNIHQRLIPVITLCVAVSCTVSPTSTPVASPSPVPSATAASESFTALLPTPIGSRRAPSDVPACRDAQPLEGSITFTWAGIEDITPSVPESNWTFYRCHESPSGVATFYRQLLPQPQYHWVQMLWEERADATLGVFYNSTSTLNVPNRWLYMWFLPDSSATQTSYLAVAWWEAPKSC